MPIGECERCGKEIIAPRDVLVWADEHTYHKECYRKLLQERYNDEVIV